MISEQKNKILILQTREEVLAAKEMFGSDLDNFTLIAWTPSAVDGLRKEGKEFKIPADFKITEYPTKIWADRFNAFREWCDVMDVYLHKTIPEARELEIKFFLNKLHNLRYFFQVYFNEIEKLFDICRSSENMEIFYFYYDKTQASLLSRIFDVVQTEDLWGVPVHRLDERKGKKFRYTFTLKEIVPYWTPKTRYIKETIKCLLGRSLDHSIVSWVRHCLGVSFLKSGVTNILVLMVENDQKRAMEELKKTHKYNFIYFDDVRFPRSKRVSIPADELWNAAKEDSSLHEWTTCCGIDIFELIEPIIKRALKKELSHIVNIVRNFLLLKEKINFNLLVSTYETAETEALFYQAEHDGIPCLVFLHGGTVGHYEGYPPITAYTRSGNGVASCYAVYSQAIIDYLEGLRNVYPNFTYKVAAVGAPRFEKMIKHYSEKKFSSNKGEINICYICGPTGVVGPDIKRGMYDDVATYNLRNLLVEKLDGKENINLFVKYGYDFEKQGLALAKRIRRGIFSNIRKIGSDVPIKKVLEKMDVFILERPSTILYETLAISKPVLVLYDPRRLRFTEHAQDLLQKRVTQIGSGEELMVLLDDIILKGYESKVFVDVDCEDRKFLKTFATSQEGDGETLSARLIREMASSC